MPDSTQDQLRQAYELIKARKREDAINLLLPILRADENNANAWWLLANAVTKPDDAREALQNVLRLRPDHDKAQEMLDKLNALHPPAPEPEPAGETFDFDDEPAEDLANVVTGAPAADPFGAPAQTFGTPSSAPGSAGGDPFGQAQTFGAPSQASADSDPFGPGAGSAATGQPRQRRPQPAASVADDPFGGSVGAPVAPRKSSGGKRTGTNPLVIVLAVVGVLAVCVCVACVAITQFGLFGIAAVGNVFVGTLEAGGFEIQAIVQTAEAGAPGMMETLSAAGIDINFAGDGSALPSGVINKGQINYGDNRRENLGQGEQQAYTFSGNAGDQVIITMTSDNTDQLDPFVALYNPENRQIASNDDDNTSLNSLLEFQLPTSGTYTILARSFTDTGSGFYNLQLQRR